MARMLATNSRVFRFADITVHEREFSLVIAGQVQAVEPKAFQVLLILLRNPNKLITKDELLNSVWADAAVTENSLARSIALLRRILGDDAREPRFIGTVTSLGYRWLCPVELMEESAAVTALQEPVGVVIAATVALPEEGGAPRIGGKRRWMWRAAAVIGAAMVLAGGIWYLSRPLPPPRITAYTQITYDGRFKDLISTDGNRLYFLQHSPYAIMQVGVNGGEIAPLPIAFPGDRSIAAMDVSINDISPDASHAFIWTAAEERNASDSQWVVPLLGGAPKRLGPGEGGAFSPDGDWVIYPTSAGEIYMVRIDGTGKHKLATLGSVASAFAWSPDGKTIRFTRDGHLWEMSADGSGVHRLLSNWKGPGVEGGGHWTPDGKFFIFGAGPPGNLANSQIWAIDERRNRFRKAASVPIQLTSGPIHWGAHFPSRDGKKIFADGYTQRGELSRIDPKTGGIQPFLGGISAEFVSFSGDGNFVAYVSYPDGTLWRVNRDGSKRMQLTKPIQDQVFNPRWSPDSKEIVFGTERPDGQTSIHRISASDGTPLWLMPEGYADTAASGDPNWSPDGKKILFGYSEKGVSGFRSGESDLRIVDLDTRRVKILPGSEGVGSPRCSPDGRYVLGFFNPAKDKLAIRIFDFVTQTWRTLPVGAGAGFPSFSRDSRWIYFLRFGRDQGVFRIPMVGGKEERVVNMADVHLTGYWTFWMSLDPTDAPLILRDTGSDDIYALSLDSN